MVSFINDYPHKKRETKVEINDHSLHLETETEKIKKVCGECGKEFEITIPFRQCGVKDINSIELRPINCDDCRKIRGK